MSIKIGSYTRVQAVRRPTTKHSEVYLKQVSSFLSVSSDYIGVFNQRIYETYSVLKDAQGKILNVSHTDRVKVTDLVRTLKNYCVTVGDTRLRNICDRIERNANSNQSYTEDLHILKQEISQTLKKINHAIA